ncbi:hypothetical protein ACFFTN_16025 [Aminobacter aganoensis]|uniref:Uncharacterized protein n=1 Tax=Aminobacter aganoensis TaxID=83264 RepID=A0A7X0KMU4_9HYPH|nr:hypothetical protein [Aminobacter aganoensis]MBB6356491.1 hypothetical protein [Aminobacter aganoensis]
MRVTSKLADVEFRFGRIERDGSTLLINSHPSQAMQTTVHMSPDDFLAFLKAMATSPSALFFLLTFPVLWFKHRNSRGTERAAVTASNHPQSGMGEPW